MDSPRLDAPSAATIHSFFLALGLIFAVATPSQAQCFDDGCTGPWGGGSTRYTLSGSPDGTAQLLADDQFNVCVNGQRVFCDSDIYAGFHPDVTFTADPGDRLLVSFLDYFGGCRSHSALWLLSDDGCAVQIAPFRDDGCNGWPRETLFAEYEFALPDWSDIDNDNDGRPDCGPQPSLRLEVQRELQVPSIPDPTVTFRNQLVTVKLVMTNDSDADVEAAGPTRAPVGVRDDGSPAARPILERVSGPTPASLALGAGESGTITYVMRARQGGKVKIKADVQDLSDAAVSATDESDPFTIAGVEIVKIEPVQVLYDVPLASRKPTKLRVTLRNAAPFDLNTRLRFTIRSLSLAQDGGPFVYNSEDILVKGRLFASDPPRETVLMWPPEGRFIDRFLGRAQLDTEITYESGSDIVDEPLEQEVDCRVIKPLRLGLVPIIGDGSQAGPGLLQGLRNDLPAAIQRVLPLGTVGAIVTSEGVYGGLLSAGAPSLRSLDRTRRLSGFDVLGGVLGPIETVSPGGTYNVTPGSYQAFYIPTGGGRNIYQAAHDVGHCFGLPLSPVKCGVFSTAIDEYCPSGTPIEQLADAGYDVLAGKEVEAGLKNVMSSEATLANPASWWINRASYVKMIESLAAFRRDPECLLVSGVIGADDVVDADPWYTYFSPSPDESNDDADWFVDQYDAAGELLASHGLTLIQAQSPDDPADSQIEFIATIERMAGLETVVLRGPQGDEFERSVNSRPVVSAIAPADGDEVEAGETIRVTWAASDADGDEITYSVLVSTDDGANWSPLAADTGETRVDWIVPDEATRAARIRVLASDGLNTGDYQSRRFIINGSADGGLVAAAGADQDAFVDTKVTLNGAASRDAADLTRGLKYQWSVAGAPADAPFELSDPDGPIASFTPPTPGLYLFELVVQAGEEVSEPDTVAIRVSGADAQISAPARNILGGDDGALQPLVDDSDDNGNGNDNGNDNDDEPEGPMPCGNCGPVPAAMMSMLSLMLLQPRGRRVFRSHAASRRFENSQLFTA